MALQLTNPIPNRSAKVAGSAKFFLNKTLGADFMEELSKTEIYKAGTRTVTDISDMHLGLKIVPRALMSFLVNHLSSMQIGETKELELPVKERRPLMRVTKHERDCFSGEIEDSTEKYTDKKVAEFKYRSIPGIGLIVMSTFELYLLDDLEKNPVPVPQDLQAQVQKMIDERMALHDLIGKVIDKKIAERDAIQQLVLAKLNEAVKLEEKKKDISELRNLNESTTPQKDPYFRGMTNGLAVAEAVITEKEPKLVGAPKKRKSPVIDFLDKRKKKLKKNEFKVELVKNEQINCPDCGQNIFNDNVFSACVCYGDCGKVFLKKTENGITVRFSKSWDPENIEMLLEVLRKKHG